MGWSSYLEDIVDRYNSDGHLVSRPGTKATVGPLSIGAKLVSELRKQRQRYEQATEENVKLRNTLKDLRIQLREQSEEMQAMAKTAQKASAEAKGLAGVLAEYRRLVPDHVLTGHVTNVYEPTQTVAVAWTLQFNCEVAERTLPKYKVGRTVRFRVDSLPKEADRFGRVSLL
jgi:hypothetical protein